MPETAAGPGADLALLTEAALAAGEIAMRHFRRDPEVWEKPDGGGPVSEADLEIDGALHGALRAARPDYGWLSEERADGPERLGAARAFVLDPIDGTRAFVAGEPQFSTALAVVEHGRPVAAVVHMPALGETYAAARGLGATLNGAPIAPSDRDAPDGAAVLATRSALAALSWRGTAPGLSRVFRTGLVWRLCLVAGGRFDAAITVRPAWEWDVAAGALVAMEAGARATDLAGQPLRFNSEAARVPSLLVAPERLHRALLDRLAPPSD